MEHLIKHINSLIGTPYKDNPPYSIQEGFDCFSWCAYLWELFSKEKYVCPVDFSSLRDLRKVFIPISDTPRIFDIALFSEIEEMELGERHIGLMMDHRIMLQCAKSTNGVSRADITRKPWSKALSGIYRHVSL